ncbi:nuclear transport factor 2 family protein [Collimonas humicola]|uniref:nuclear transport factor 2 family protein n=1 Tax=Collimonas humicola TaxID=2825886 RepID=UPI001B8B2158|nr:nuclear transport factor 2 family protein [Collimonas humicola]
MKQLFIAASLFALPIGSALAGPAVDAAQTHFAAIGAGNIPIIMRGYADSAQLNWVGGPLDGTYVSQDNIRGTWEKFGKAVGPLKVTINNLEESVNPKGATVLANVQFEGKMPIKVRYVLTYRDGKLVSETWQIDPKLAFAAY